MVMFILSGIFVGYAPPLHQLIEKDFMRRAYNNANLEGLQYGDLGLRARTIVPSDDHDVNREFPGIPGNPVPVPLYTKTKDGHAVVQRSLNCRLRVPQLTAQHPDVNIRVTVTKQ